jgi:hypothetical protein
MRWETGAVTEHEHDDQENVDGAVDDPTGPRPSDRARRSINSKAELRAMETILEVLEPLPSAVQLRTVEWVVNVLELPTAGPHLPPPIDATAANGAVPPPVAQTPKAYLTAKKPQNAAEKIACLAYYLAHHRAMEHFKRADIVQLNTEAAAVKFGNASRDLNNAENSSGYIVAAGSGGLKQITPRGEALVDAMPNREAVAVALKEHPFKRRRSSGARKPSAPEDES